MTPEEIEQIQSIVRDGIDRAVEAMSANFSDVREEMNRRFDRVDERLASLEHRLDSVEYEMVGFKKSPVRLSNSTRAWQPPNRRNSARSTTLHAQFGNSRAG